MGATTVQLDRGPHCAYCTSPSPRSRALVHLPCIRIAYPTLPMQRYLMHNLEKAAVIAALPMCRQISAKFDVGIASGRPA